MISLLEQRFLDTYNELKQYKEQIKVLTDALYETNNLVARQAEEINKLEEHISDLRWENERLNYTYERNDY